MAGVTRANLRTKIYRRCDLENTQTQVATEVNDHIQDASNACWDLCIATLGERFAPKSDTLAVTAGVASYSLVSGGVTDFYRPIRTELLLDGIGYPLGTFELSQFTRSTTAAPWASWAARFPRYLIAQGLGGGDPALWGILFDPPPDSARTLNLTYHPVPPVYTADSGAGGVINFGIDAAHDWILLECVVRMKDKEERDTADYERQRAQIEQRISEWGSPVDMAQPIAPEPWGGHFGRRRLGWR